MDNILNSKDKTYYDSLENDAIKEITLLQYDIILKNKSLPDICKIPKYEYFNYIEQNIKYDAFIKRDLKKFNFFKQVLAPNYKHVNELPYGYYKALDKYIPIYEDLNIFYLIGGLYVAARATIKEKYLKEEPIIATLPIPGFNAKFTKLECNKNAILINRSLVRLLGILNDLLNRNADNVSLNLGGLDEFFVEVCVSHSMKKFTYLKEENLSKLQTITKQNSDHFLIEDIALFFIIAHEIAHDILDDTIYGKTKESVNKFDDNIPKKLSAIGAKFYKEQQVDSHAAFMVIQFYRNRCSHKTIYEGFCLALIPGFINELNLGSNEMQPPSKIRLESIEISLNHYLNWDKNMYNVNILSNFYSLWENNKSNIGEEIINQYSFD